MSQGEIPEESPMSLEVYPEENPKTPKVSPKRPRTLVMAALFVFSTVLLVSAAILLHSRLNRDQTEKAALGSPSKEPKRSGADEIDFVIPSPSLKVAPKPRVLAETSKSETKPAKGSIDLDRPITFQLPSKPSPRAVDSRSEGEQAPKRPSNDTKPAVTPASLSPASKPIEKPAPISAEDRDTVVITLTGVPKGASILVNGKPSGTPFTAKRSKKALKVEVRLPGYAKAVRRVVPLRDKPILFRLKKG